LEFGGKKGRGYWEMGGESVAGAGVDRGGGWDPGPTPVINKKKS